MLIRAISSLARLNRKVTYFDSMTKYPRNKNYTYQNKSSTHTAYTNRTERTIMIYQADYEKYYQPRMGKVDAQAKSILREMAQPHTDMQKVKSKLEFYLDTSKANHSAQGLLLLTTAMWKDNLGLDARYLSTIVEFINRHYEVNQFNFDNRSLMAVLHVFVKKLEQTQERMKMTMLKFRIIELLRGNLSLVEDKYLAKVLKIVLDVRNPNAISQKLKFASLTTLLETKINTYLKNNILESDKEEEEEEEDDQCIVEDWVQSSFLKSAVSFYRQFTPEHDESISILYESIAKTMKTISKQNKFFVYGFYIYFPSRGKNSQGVYYRDLLLEVIKLIYNPTLRNITEYEWNQSMLCYSIISFSFYKYMDKLQFRYGKLAQSSQSSQAKSSQSTKGKELPQSNSFNYLLAEDISTPELSPYFWQWYQQRHHSMNTDNKIMSHIIKNIYPQQYIPTSISPEQTIKPHELSENEIKTRIILALQMLGISSQAETEVCGRYVDFLLEDKIILQCDGEGHFNMHKMEFSEDTQFRNLHLLLSGYRLILINIFEYNENRYAKDLSVLIKKKLDFMKENQAVLVI